MRPKPIYRTEIAPRQPEFLAALVARADRLFNDRGPGGITAQPAQSQRFRASAMARGERAAGGAGVGPSDRDPVFG